MKENDTAFINQVVDFYYTTLDDEHPQGNMSVVAERFAITRAKVNKVLLTAGVIDSPLHQDIMELKERGYATEDIGAALGVSEATVKINMPYEKVIYNGASKSAGAAYVAEFRKREQVFLSNVVRKPTELEQERERYFSDPEHVELQQRLEEEGFLDDMEFEDDPLHLMPWYSEEESKLFKMRADVMVLHVELDADLAKVRELAEIKYPRLLAGGAETYTISRDLLVPCALPLHNLHYALNQAFGFTHSHLHEYTLSEHDLQWVTEGKVSKWKKLAGLVFKNPLRDEDLDFWDDDYEGGSPKKWMRSKYTGPAYAKVLEETYRYIQDELRGMRVKSKNLEQLRREFFLNPLAVNETLPVMEILSEDGQQEYKDIKEYDKEMRACVREAAPYPADFALAQPFVYAFAETLEYRYDFGDNWEFIIKPYDNVEYLERAGRITAAQMREAIKDVCTLARPIVIAADGLPLVEDVGGVQGYMDFLKGINGLPSAMYADKEESLTWAKGNGWPGKVGNLKTLL